MTFTNPILRTGAQQPFGAQRQWSPVIALLIIALIACAWWIVSLHPDKMTDPTQTISLHYPFIAVAIILTGLCAGAGYLVSGRIDGILIDERNRVSLSRLQWVAWIIVLLGGYFTEAVWNVTGKQPFPDMQGDLWALLGVVSGSAVASNLIVDKKKTAPQPGNQSQPSQPAQAGQPDQIGSIDRNATVAEASWADLFMGEEVANRNVVDISRLQQLVITVLLVVAYVKLLWDALAAAGLLLNMPPVAGAATASGAPGGGSSLANNTDHGFLWLLGISHAAYIASKATPKSGPGTAPAGGTTAAQPVAAAAAPPVPLTAVPVRVAITDAGSIQGLLLAVDNHPVTVPGSGFVELSLDTDVIHRLEASGTRNGQSVRGQLLIRPSVDDLNRAYELTLS